MLKKLKLAVCTALAIPLMAAMSSCSSEEDVTCPDVETASASADNIKSALKNSYSGLLDADLSFDAPSRSSQALLTTMPKAANVYVKMPAYSDHADVTMVKEAKSVNALLTATREVGAELSYVRTSDSDVVVTLSEEKAMEALAPLIEESKKYLYSKGFSEKDIQDMVLENGVTEADLVTFVLAFSELEENQNSSFQLDNNLSGVAYAVGAGPVNETKIDWNKAGQCALKAIGADIFMSISQSTLKTWGYAAMKRAFTTVAKKLVGPIGVAIMVGEFTGCYFDLW